MNIMKTQIKFKSKQKPHNRTQNKANYLLCNIVLVQKQTNKNKMKQYTTHKTNTLLLSNALSVQNKTKTTKQNTKQSKLLVMQHCVGSKTNKQNETYTTQNKNIVVKQRFVSSKQNKNTTCRHLFLNNLSVYENMFIDKSYWKYVLNACKSLFKTAHLQQ